MLADGLILLRTYKAIYEGFHYKDIYKAIYEDIFGTDVKIILTDMRPSGESASSENLTWLNITMVVYSDGSEGFYCRQGWKSEKLNSQCSFIDG